MPTINRKLRVFLCHASQDRPLVRELYQRFLSEGWIDPWLDEKKLLPGQDWRTSIEEAVESSDLVVICLSNNSVGKEGFVQKELRYAREISLEKPEGTIFLIPLRLEECDVPRGLRFFQWTDYFGGDKEQNYHDLLEAFSIRRRQVVQSEEVKSRKATEEREREEARARREAEESAQREILEKQRLEAELHARKEKEERERLEAELRARKEKEEQARKKTERQNAKKPSLWKRLKGWQQNVIALAAFVGMIYGETLIYSFATTIDNPLVWFFLVYPCSLQLSSDFML